MSGFAGVVHLDRAPVSGALIRRMAAAMAFRGPDATTIRIEDGAAFAHTHLDTTGELVCEQQPLTLDARMWIVGDVRLDARDDLIAALPDPKSADLTALPDLALVLHAYHAWGSRAVESLTGDFAFAIWDAARARLFGARDHMGVRPFYYAHAGSFVVFSNTFECVRLHPLVSDRLNDRAVADFLLFDANQDPATTTFADVHRLAPAHTLLATRDGLTTARYWTLPIDEPQFFRRADDYVDGFRSLLQASIDSRLRTRRVGVFMSGGLDSTSLAAMTTGRMRARGAEDVHALTWAEDGHDGGRERQYASLAAAHLGIPHDVHAIEADPIDWAWERSARYDAEPDSCTWRAAAADAYHRRIASSLRVVFHGEGPDNALYYEWQPYLRYLMRTRRAPRLAIDASRYLVTQRRLPLWNRLWSSWSSWPSASDEAAARQSFPTWLNRDFERRWRLRDRWHDASTPAPSVHPVRPESYASLTGPLWPKLFEWFDADRTRVPLEVRHPFVDVRLLRFMLAVPAIPWCRGKYLLRRAMRDDLPAAVLVRTKRSLPPRQWWETERRLVSAPFFPTSSIAEYVNIARLPDARRANPHTMEQLLRIRSLNRWLALEKEHVRDQEGHAIVH